YLITTCQPVPSCLGRAALPVLLQNPPYEHHAPCGQPSGGVVSSDFRPLPSVSCRPPREQVFKARMFTFTGSNLRATRPRLGYFFHFKLFLDGPVVRVASDGFGARRGVGDLHS